MPRFLLSLLLLLLINYSVAQNCCDVDDEVDLCYLSGADYCGSNLGSCFEYSLDGLFMENALTTKLLADANFGPDGIVDCTIEIKKLEDVSSVQAINDCGCDMIFVPNVFVAPGGGTINLEETAIPDDVMQNIYDWSIECDNNLVILTQNEANLWGYVTTNSNVNPNTPVLGTSINSIFEGPFGSLDFFNQGGTYQGVFTTTPSTDFEILAYDANQNITAALDLVTKDIVVGDVGIFCSGPGDVTFGEGINNNNDILVCNMFALACELAQEGNRVTVTEELCPGETVTLPDGMVVNSAGIYIDTLPSFNGCDSIITTSVAYGIEDGPIFTQPDTTICEGDTITLDGSLPIDFPIPFFENTTDYLIDPPFVSVVSEIPVTGFGALTLEAGMIQSICIDIDHIWLDDLDIVLVAPNGEILELSTDNGFSDDNYVGTCFTENATVVIGSPGTNAPFTGDFLPEGDWNEIYGSPINGSWQLIVRDDSNGFIGTLLNWSITFAPVLDISYQWETSDGLSCDDCPITEAGPDISTTYFLTLTDSYGCTAVDSTAIEVLPALPAPIISCDDITINSITVNWGDIAGANGYEININGSGWGMPNNGDLSHILGGLMPLDTFQILVRAFDDCSGAVTALICSTPDCIAPIPSLESMTPATCFGDSDGAIDLTAVGGSGSGYVYELNGEFNTTGIFNNLAAGTYEVVVMDDESCDITFPVIVTQPDSIELNPQIDTPISCFGDADGALTVGVQAGVEPFTFFWDGVAGAPVLTQVSAGTYEISVLDANGCFTIDSIEIDQPTQLIAATDSTEVDCNGNNTGSASVLPQGGTSPYNYQWDAFANNQTDATATNLAAGTYSVIVTDDNDCPLEISVDVTEPEALGVDVEAFDPNCFEAEDGTIALSANGGVPSYTYTWDSGLPDGAINNALSSGTYNITITDSNDCEISIEVTLEDPAPIVVDAIIEDAECFGDANGSISLAVTGAIGDASFDWDNGNLSADNTDLSAGQYCVTVSDENSCEAIVCYDIMQPLALETSFLAQNVSCDDTDNGEIDLSVTGGTSPYQYNWSIGENTQDVANLEVGNYLVTITDANNCEVINSIEIEQSEAQFSVSLLSNSISCNGLSDGSITVLPQGIFQTLSFDWSGPNNYQSTNQDINDLEEGSYEVIIQDENACIVTANALVTEPDPLESELDITDVSCFGFEDGQLIVFSNGGTPPYNYSLGTDDFSNSGLFGGLNPGDYSILIQDSNGCEEAIPFTITEPAEVRLNIDRINEMMLGGSFPLELTVNLNDSQIDTIIWTPTDSLSCTNCLDPIANPLFSTEYFIQLIDENGCLAEANTWVIVDRRVPVFVPNIFSPNGDGNNDIVTVFSSEQKVVVVKSFQIFDRWGANVFASDNFFPNDLSAGWDGTLNGKEMNSGVFVWFAEVELLDGRTELVKGDVVLVR